MENGFFASLRMTGFQIPLSLILKYGKVLSYMNELYEKFTKRMICLFLLVNIPFYMAMMYFTYVCPKTVSMDFVYVLWFIAVTCIEIPFTGFIAHYAKIAKMKIARIIFTYLFCIAVIAPVLMLLIALFKSP